MCGIAGFCGQWGKVSAQAEVVECMVAAIRHRGPDAQNIHVEEKIGFGHARLSIIDLAAGAQPMANDDGDGLDHASTARSSTTSSCATS